MLILYFLLFVIIGLLNFNSNLKNFAVALRFLKVILKMILKNFAVTTLILFTKHNTNVVFLSTLITPSAILMLYSLPHYCEFYSTLLIKLIQFLFYILFQILILFHKFQCFIVILIEFFSSYCFYFFNYFWIFIVI